MNDQLDLLWERVDLQEVANWLSLDVGHGSGRVMCPRREHGNDRDDPGTVAKGSTWYCHKCGEGGGALDFVEAVRNEDRGEALKWLARRYGTELNGKRPPVEWFERKAAEAKRELRILKEIAAARPNDPEGERIVAEAEKKAKAAGDRLASLESATEIELAEAFVEQHGGTVCFDPSRGWFRWEKGVGWHTGGVVPIAAELVKRASDGDKDHDRKRIQRHATIGGVLSLSKDRLLLPGSTAADGRAEDAWDSEAGRVASPCGGIFDLRTGGKSPSTRHDLMLRRLGAPPSADYDWWQAQVEEWMGDDLDLVSYLQRVMGYALVGDPREQQIFIFHGPQGREGKSTFIRAVVEAAGSYADITAPNTFAGSPRDREHPTDLAKLAGQRIVCATEAPDKSTWRAERMKTISGGDPVSARFMRKDFFTFTPRCTLILVANELPRIGQFDGAMKRRLRVVRWGNPVSEKAKDVALPEKISRRRGEVVRWLLDGASAYYREGLRQPKSVTGWTREYTDEEDTITRFLDERTEVDFEAWALRKDLRRGYVEFCKDEERAPAGTRVWMDRLRRLPHVSETAMRGGRAWRGIRLIEGAM